MQRKYTGSYNFLLNLSLSIFACSVFEVNISSANEYSYSQKLYPASECSPSEMQNSRDSLEVSYSENLNLDNNFLVGWKLYHDQATHSSLGPMVGGEVQIARCLPPGRWVRLAEGNVEKINGSTVEAVVHASDFKEANFGKIPVEYLRLGNIYWRPMVGDSVFLVQKEVSSKVSINPIVRISTKDLFVNLNDGSYSYSLSENGQNILSQKYNLFKQKNGRLAVEGFVLHSGDREKLRIDSLMRAQAVSNYFVRAFNLTSAQVMAFGYGADWLKVGMQPLTSWPREEINDGIVLRLIPSLY